MTVPELDRSAPTFVAAHRGLIGSAVLRHVREVGSGTVVTGSAAVAAGSVREA